MASENGNSFFTGLDHKDESVFYLGSRPRQMGSQLALFGKEVKHPFFLVRAGDKSGGGLAIKGRDGGGFQTHVMRQGTFLLMLRGDSQPGCAVKTFGAGGVMVNSYDEKGQSVVWLKSPDRERGK